MSAQFQHLLAMLGAAQIDCDAIAGGGGSLWAFGSRAAGCSQPTSDWDVLLVSREVRTASRVRLGQLDLVCVTLSSFLGDWQQSELATHVGTYGVCLSGTCRLKVIGQPLVAALRKKAVVSHRAVIMHDLWDALRPPHRRQEATRLRRDLQRVALLESGVAIPPGPLLDLAWAESNSYERHRVVRTIPLTPRVERAALFGVVDERL